MVSNDRYTRRQLKKELGPRVMQHPYVKRLKRNIREAGKAATEVYRLNGPTPDQHRYFDVYTMQKWTHEHLRPIGTFLNWDRAEYLITSGAVDPDRIRDHTIQHEMEPIIIGVGACHNGEDQILDGAHRYVAYALSATQAGLQGVPLPLPAYVLEPGQWRQFLIPPFVVRALRFDEGYESDAHKWPSVGGAHNSSPC